jgi:Methyltransferase FkbM domain
MPGKMARSDPPAGSNCFPGFVPAQTRSPLVVKIDVEGGEQLVLQGAREFLSRHKPMILLEVHNIQLMFYVQSMLIEFATC